ncbi:hypothetical protein CTI12_AA057800 [Artemisia annua]|uniref:RING-CH-type domain-containing protein n=1 Tax=Artemisia annua TaxID=35608 RepID=A0A2U1NQL6_ARTAN|nr:hypothetical protein CTI12_AA057800 [Artemisia annua]
MAENLSEIMKDEKDVEGGSIVTCRICLQCADGVKDEGLISPCMCKGTQQFVHRSCLDHWRSVKVIGMLGGLAYLVDHKHEYLKDLFKDHWDHVLLRHPILFYYCAGMIVFLVLLTLCAMICQCCYTNMCSEPCGTIFCIVFMVMLISPAYLCAFFGGAMARPWRHYHQKELTKEYVVEDLNGCYSTPAELDPVHMERLKSLKLL